MKPIQITRNGYNKLDNKIWNPHTKHNILKLGQDFCKTNSGKPWIHSGKKTKKETKKYQF
jgi:hypothetical protein